MTERLLRPRAGRRRARLLAVALAVLVSLVAAPTAAGAGGEGGPGHGGGHGHGNRCERSTNNSYSKLLDCVTPEGVFEHLEAFQDIADANGGTRASATPGYDASADYVAGLLDEAGYDVTRQVFEFPFFEETTPAVLEQLTPVVATYESGTYEYSGGGDVTGAVVSVEVNVFG